MIRAIINGASTPQGAELIRILINHPDVHITAPLEPRLAGVPVSSRITGLIGDTDIKFTESANVAKSDVLFICDNTAPLPFDVDSAEASHLRVVDLSGHTYDSELWVQGICELNRKPMVRGALRAYVPQPLAIITTTALLPMARNLLLNNTINVATDHVPTYTTNITDQVRKALSTLQNSFNAVVNIGRLENGGYNAALAESTKDPSPRFMQAVITTTVPIDAQSLVDMYQEYFDDHNFVYLLNRDITEADVVNTNKCLLHVSTDGHAVRIHAAMDPQIHGCAGAAVHCMNLLFGLHERIGLQLKAL